jgi:hypothetical protein
MNTITLHFYQRSVDIPAFQTLDEALQSEPVNIINGWRGYLVAFEVGGLYGVYMHNEDKYYKSFLPHDAKVLRGGWWEPGKTTEWKVIGGLDHESKRILSDLFGDDNLDLFE